MGRRFASPLSKSGSAWGLGRHACKLWSAPSVRSVGDTMDHDADKPDERPVSPATEGEVKSWDLDLGAFLAPNSPEAECEAKAPMNLPSSHDDALPYNEDHVLFDWCEDENLASQLAAIHSFTASDIICEAVFNRIQEKTHKSELADKWDRIFRDICREIVCPPALDNQDDDGRHLEVGWQSDAAGLDESGVLHAEFLNNAEDDADAATMLGGAGDVGSEIGSGVFIEGGFNLEGDDFKPWDVDLGEFMNDVEEDADAATMLGSSDIGLDIEEDETGIGERLSAVHATDSDSSMFFEKSGGFHSRETLDEVFELGDPDKIGENQMLSTMGESSIDDRWDFAPYALSGILERVLCEPQDFLSNKDPEYPSDSYMIFWYRGPWRRKFGTALRLLSLSLISVWGVALLVLLAGETVWSAVTKNPSNGLAIQCVSGVVFLAGVLELFGLFQTKNSLVRLLFGRPGPCRRYR
jgi:hypothetical protein